MDLIQKFECLVSILYLLSGYNRAVNPPYSRLYPPFSHQNSPEKACLTDEGAISRGQHRFQGPKCQILYCPPNPKIHEIIVIECSDYINMTNLPENFPDTEKRMYLKICQYCRPVSPTFDLDLMEPDSTPMPEDEEITNTTEIELDSTLILKDTNKTTS